MESRVVENVLTVPTRNLPAQYLPPRRWNRSAANDDVPLESMDSALCALTDFQRDEPLTIGAGCGIDEALSAMNRATVHALLVTRRDLGGEDEQVVGLVTYSDIARTRATRFARVGEVMTACDDLALVHWQSLLSLTSTHLYQLFSGTGLTHLLVVEYHCDGTVKARGLVSRASLGRRLGRP